MCTLVEWIVNVPCNSVLFVSVVGLDRLGKYLHSSGKQCQYVQNEDFILTLLPSLSEVIGRLGSIIICRTIGGLGQYGCDFFVFLLSIVNNSGMV